MKRLILAAAIAAAGCTHVPHEELGNDRHRMSYTEPPLANVTTATNLITRKAETLCPHGFETERQYMRDYGDGPVYYMEFRCLPPATGGRS